MRAVPIASIFRRLVGLFRPAERSRVSPQPGGAHQVAVIPVRVSRSGKRKVLLISTRGGDKLIIPRGWPMKGKADFQAAALEAEEEAGVLGTVTLLPIGAYVYQDGRKAAGRPIHVDVYRLDVTRRLPTFKEKGERRLVWLELDEAVRRVGEPGLVPILKALSTTDKQAGRTEHNTNKA